jgi:FixJ family two-component response regulator
VTEEQAIVFVVDDDPSMRATLSDVMRSVGLEVRTFKSAQEFLEQRVARCAWLPRTRCPAAGQSGLDFQRTLADSGIDLPVVFITGHGDVPMSVRAMKAGAVDFLIKPFRDQDLLDAVHAAIKRDRVRRQDATRLVDLRERFQSLTQRERDVMALVVLGRLNKQIAAELGVAEVTVKAHRSQTMHKMGADSLAELVRIADQLSGSLKKG